MPEVTVYSADGAAGPGLALEESIFGAEVRADLVHAAVVAHLAGKRHGTASARSRGELRGGGRKPYRQKGTGRARQGSTNAPQYRGGGVVFPPKPRDYSQRLPRRVRRAALASAWSAHVADDTLRVVAAFELDELKTARAAAALRTLLQPLADSAAATAPAPRARDEEDTRPVRRVKVKLHALVLLGPDEMEQRRAFRNLSEVRFDYADKVSVIYRVRNVAAPYATVYDLTLADAVVATQAAIARVAAEFAPVEDDEEVPA